jgi:lipopolysaccharide transport system permease protein
MREVRVQAGLIGRDYWRDVWHSKDLFLMLVWRDIAVRYKETRIGVLWSLARPVITMITFTLFFGRLARMPSMGVPYLLMVAAGALPWQMFSGSVAAATSSLVNSGSMVTKIYFPRILLVASSILVNVIDALVSFFVLVALLVHYKFWPSPNVLFLPAFFALGIIVSAAVGVWLSVLALRFRDVTHLTPYLVQVGLFLAPIGYSASIIPKNWQFAYFLNPMAGVIEGVRWSLLGSDAAMIHWGGFWVSVAITTIVLILGLRFFRSSERWVADYL